MGFMDTGRGFHYRNYFCWCDQKHPSFTRQTLSKNTNWETAALHMSVAEEVIRKAPGRINTLLEWWGYTNFPIYHVERLHNYRNCLNKMDPYVAERAKRSIQEYAQRNSAIWWSRGFQGIQYGRGQTYSTTMNSMLSERRDQLSQYWNEEGFSSLDQ